LGRDFTATYGPNKKIGKGTMSITGIGGYEGTATVNFKIVPSKDKVKKLTAGHKSIKVSWTHVSSKEHVTKYQLRYRVKGAKAWKTKTFSAKTAKASIKKLKKGKAYQVEVRSYKTVKSHKYIAEWSAPKTSKKVK
jgi:hypothetical protein